VGNWHAGDGAAAGEMTVRPSPAARRRHVPQPYRHWQHWSPGIRAARPRRTSARGPARGHDFHTSQKRVRIL